MTFTTTPLLNGGYLVEGTDTKGVEGTTILDSNSWDALVHLRTHKLAQEDFDQVVGEFFAPLVEAADKARAQLKGAAQDWGTVTLGEKVTGHEAEIVQLDSDGIILRLLDEGHDDLLRWVGSRLVAVQS
jgi:hypothetical protein